jgi:hypothetical protein
VKRGSDLQAGGTSTQSTKAVEVSSTVTVHPGQIYVASGAWLPESPDLWTARVYNSTNTGNPTLSFYMARPGCAAVRGFARDGPGVNGTQPEEELS